MFLYSQGKDPGTSLIASARFILLWDSKKLTAQ